MVQPYSELYKLLPDGTQAQKIYIAGGTQDGPQFTENIVFHAGANEAANGFEMPIEAHKTITVEITSTASSFTAVFEGLGPDPENQTWQAITSVDVLNLELGSESIEEGIWTSEITGFTKYRVRISSLTGGIVRVVGKAVT